MVGELPDSFQMACELGVLINTHGGNTLIMTADDLHKASNKHRPVNQCSQRLHVSMVQFEVMKAHPWSQQLSPAWHRQQAHGQ